MNVQSANHERLFRILDSIVKEADDYHSYQIHTLFTQEELQTVLKDYFKQIDFKVSAHLLSRILFYTMESSSFYFDFNTVYPLQIFAIYSISKLKLNPFYLAVIKDQIKKLKKMNVTVMISEEETALNEFNIIRDSNEYTRINTFFLK